jgi:hypothetical protein
MKAYGGVDVQIHVVLTNCQLRATAALPARKKSPVPIVWEAGWVPELVVRHEEEKILDPTDTRTPTPLRSSQWQVAIPTALYGS